jgi:hypothetical protein
MALTSDEFRSENSTPMVGCDMRSMTKAKNPTSASVTASMAARRGAPKRENCSTMPLTPLSVSQSRPARA